MSGYLQRLLDRAPPAPAAAAPSMALAMPAGPSLSPIALADQRLNDPSLLDQIGPPRLAEPEAPEGSGFDSLHSESARAWQPRPDAGTGQPSSDLAPTSIKPAQAPAVSPPPPRPEAIESGIGEARARQRSPSEIDSEDLLPPESAEPAVLEPAARHSTRPAAAEIEPAAPPSPAVSRTQPADAAPSQESVEAMPAPPVRARSTQQPELREAPSARVQAPLDAPEAQPARADTTSVVDVEPPPQRAPAPLPPESLDQNAARAPAPSPPREPKREGEQKPESVTPETSQPVRSAPRSAAEASIIGALARRPRALTLFGLRRR